MKVSVRYVLTGVLLAAPVAASANMIWPSLYIVEQYYVWYVIVAGLLIETIAAQIFLNTGWLKSFGMMLAVNAISALLGVLLIPTSGLAVEILMVPFDLAGLPGGTFGISHWILDYLAVVAVNTVVEWLALHWIFKYPLKKNFWWMLGANSVSVVICVLVPMIKYMGE